MKYRREIDGLRALAVVPVVFYHAGMEWFSGGYVGVDVFFVISGYLISLIILSEIRSGNFSIIGFYERRARRILPALFAMMLVTTPFVWLVMMPHQLKDYAQSLVATSLFSANVLFWLESGYFELASELKPLLHTWSLAVEEQFYFIYPILVLLIWKVWRSALPAVLVATFIASLAAAHFLSSASPNANFYLPFSRAWELALGAMAAYFVLQRGLPASRFDNLLALAGIAMILASIHLFDGDTPFPGIYAVPAVFGTGLVILFAKPSNFAGRLFSLGPVVGIGLVSYSFYLWHFPVFAIARLWLNSEPSAMGFVALIALSFALAAASFKYVETPFRNKKIFGRKTIFSTSLVGVIFFLAIGYQGHVKDGFIDYKLAQVPENRVHLLVDIQKEKEASRAMWEPLLDAASRSFTEHSKHNVLILGDSVAEDMYVALAADETLYPDIEFRLLRLDDACMNGLNDLSSAPKRCRRSILALRESALSGEANTVLVTATWQQHTVTAIREVIRFFDRPDTTLLVFGSANFNDVASLSYQIVQQGIPPKDWGRFFAENKREDWNAQNKRLQAILLQENVPYIDKYGAYCSQQADGEHCHLFAESGRPLMWDTGHVTAEGAANLGLKSKDLNWLPKY